MRADSISIEEVTKALVDLNSRFTHSTHKAVSDALGDASINFKWNADSSVSMVYSFKKDREGFKRETIVHVKDSVLFIKRFLVGPASDTIAVNFVESYDYLTPSGTIKTLVRVKNGDSVSDSISFRKKPFRDYSKEVQEHYSFELDYCQNILQRN